MTEEMEQPVSETPSVTGGDKKGYWVYVANERGTFHRTWHGLKAGSPGEQEWRKKLEELLEFYAINTTFHVLRQERGNLFCVAHREAGKQTIRQSISVG